MADNTTLNSGSGGDVVRTIDKAGQKTQVVTLDLGGSGTESLVAGALPVTGAFYQATQPVSGTINVGNLPATQAVSGTVALDSASLAALETISVANFPASQAVTGTVALDTASLAALETISVANFPATQPVSIAATVNTNTGLTQPLTDTQLRASAVPVSGTFFQATQPVSIAGTVNVSNGQTQPLTDAQLRASAVPVSIGGTVATSIASQPLPAGAATDASLTGHAQTFKPVTPITTISGANAAVTLTIPAAGVGLFTYITRVVIRNINPTATAIAGSAVTLAYTSTNIPGSLAWTAGNALAAGAEKVVTDEVLGQPIKTAAANTATTIVAPAIGAGGLCRITAYYYTGA